MFTLALDLASIPPTLDQQEVLTAAEGAARAWNQVACSRISVQVAPRAVRGRSAEEDRISSLTFLGKQWCRNGVERAGACYDRRMAAFTTQHRGTTIAGTGEIAILEIDIELNAVNFDWAMSPPPTSAEQPLLDVQSVITHELGHALGFEHPCGRLHSRSLPACSQLSPAARASVMFPFAVDGGGALLRRNLSDDDREGVCRIYPASAAIAPAQAAVEPTPKHDADRRLRLWLLGAAALLLCGGGAVSALRRRFSRGPR